MDRGSVGGWRAFGVPDCQCPDCTAPWPEEPASAERKNRGLNKTLGARTRHYLEGLAIQRELTRARQRLDRV